MILIDSVIGIEPMSDVQGGISPQNNLLPLASRKTTQIHWHVLSLIHLSSLEAQHYLNFREEEKEVQRWKRMPRSWPQCPKGKTDYSSWIWDDQIHPRQAKLTASSAMWLRTKLDQGTHIQLLGKTYRDVWPRALGLQEENVDPFLMLPSQLLFLRMMLLSRHTLQRCDLQKENTFVVLPGSTQLSLLAKFIPSNYLVHVHPQQAHACT